MGGNKLPLCRARAEYQINLSFQRPEDSQVEKYQSIPVAAVTDAMGFRGALPEWVRPLYSPIGRVVGPAFTVHNMPGDEVLVLKAIECAQRGDVIVVASGRLPRRSLWGGVMSLMAQKKGIAGLLTDSLVRDKLQIQKLGFPVFAAGHTPIAPGVDFPPGEMNHPIVIGDVVIEPGDLVVADEDGIAIVPLGELDTVHAAAVAQLEKEARWVEEIEKTGEMIFSGMVAERLSRRTCQLEDTYICGANAKRSCPKGTKGKTPPSFRDCEGL